MGNGEWEMGNGEWGMGNGEWGMGNGEWGMGNGKWEMGRILRDEVDVMANQLLFCARGNDIFDSKK